MASASLSDLFTLLNDPTLSQKVAAAVIRTSVSVAFEDTGTPNHANRLIWSKNALANPTGTASEVLRYVIAAAYVSVSPPMDLPSLQSLSDVVIQANVDASLAIFAS